MSEAYAEVFSHAVPTRALALLRPDVNGIVVSILITAHTGS
jgi:2-iminobutanoate/2-iminopropanoate deaminase